MLEVLPVMYSNLLYLYGAHPVRARLNQDISRPNFYDVLYG